MLSGCPPETYMSRTGSWKPSPTLMGAGCSGLESGLVGEQVHSMCSQQEMGISTPDSCKLTVFQRP